MMIRLHYATAEAFRDIGPWMTPAELAAVDRTVVWEGDICYLVDDFQVCEILFDRFNRHDSPTQHPALDQLGLRSLSVGDVVEFVEPGNGRFYVCASRGWTPIEGVRVSFVLRPEDPYAEERAAKLAVPFDPDTVD